VVVGKLTRPIATAHSSFKDFARIRRSEHFDPSDAPHAKNFICWRGGPLGTALAPQPGLGMDILNSFFFRSLAIRKPQLTHPAFLRWYNLRGSHFE
jgi:hypothetical protein